MNESNEVVVEVESPVPRGWFWRHPNRIFILLWLFLLSPLGMFSVLIIPILIHGLIVAAVYRKRVGLVLLLVLNPMCVFFFGGVIDYWQGSPTLNYMGYPASNFFNIDPETRCFKSNGGCVINGGEWVYQSTHNYGVLMMCNIFGPPARSYHGPYPTRDEAILLMGNAETIDTDAFRSGAFKVGGEVFELPQEMIERYADRWMLYGLSGKYGYGSELEIVVRGGLYQGRCLILGIQQFEVEPRSANPFLEADMMILIDTKTMRPFAHFDNSEQSRMPFPPVRYLPEQDW